MSDPDKALKRVGGWTIGPDLPSVVGKVLEEHVPDAHYEHLHVYLDLKVETKVTEHHGDVGALRRAVRMVGLGLMGVGAGGVLMAWGEWAVLRLLFDVALIALGVYAIATAANPNDA